MAGIASDLVGAGISDAVIAKTKGAAYLEAEAKNPYNGPAQGFSHMISVELADNGELVSQGMRQGNIDLFSNVFPRFMIYDMYGPEGLKACPTKNSQQVDKALIQISEGKVEKGNWDILDYEQNVVLQDGMYANKEFDKVLVQNKKSYDYFYGRLFGAKKVAVPFPDGSEVVFEGKDLSSTNERMTFINKVWDKYSTLMKENKNMMEKELLQIRERIKCSQ